MRIFDGGGGGGGGGGGCGGGGSMVNVKLVCSAVKFY